MSAALDDFLSGWSDLRGIYQDTLPQYDSVQLTTQQQQFQNWSDVVAAIETFAADGGWLSMAAQTIEYSPESTFDRVLCGELFKPGHSLNIQLRRGVWILTEITETEDGGSGGEACLADTVTHLHRDGQRKLNYRRYWRLEDHQLRAFGTRLTFITEVENAQ